MAEQGTGKGVVIGVPRETAPGERRVALTPDAVKRLTGAGATVIVEKDAGAGSSFSDDEYEAAGASVAKNAEAVYKKADLIVKVQRPQADPAGGHDETTLLRRGQSLIALLSPLSDPELAGRLADAGVDAYSMDAIPRITRAQSMDVLSSQATVSGYKSVLLAAMNLPKFFPMLTTAAGSITPAKVLVVGAGVAGLQAIATARRLGAIVSATDVRPAAKEEIKSLGAAFVGVEDEETAAQKGAYAGQMSEAFLRKQAELVAATVAKNDIVVCTALVMGRRAPTLLTEAMVNSMKPGIGGVKILGYRNWPGRIAVASSALYARNLLTFLTGFWDKEAKAPR
ncbi:MAG: NAD(P) transhydrogenase subunit alpha, partial [Chloroflexota bacterium]